MAELADALDSGSSESNFIWVQVPSSAPYKSTSAYVGVLLYQSLRGIEGETAMNDSPVGCQNRGTPCPQARQVPSSAPNSKNPNLITRRWVRIYLYSLDH